MAYIVSFENVCKFVCVLLTFSRGDRNNWKTSVENMFSLTMKVKHAMKMLMSLDLVMKVLRRTRETIGRIMLKMVESHSM